MQSFSFAEMQPLLPLIIAQPQRFRNAKSPVPATGLLHIPLPAPRGHTRVLPFPEKSLPASAAAPSASACRAALPALLVAFETTSSAPRCFCPILRSQFEIAAPVMRDPRPVENGRQNKHRVKNGHALFFPGIVLRNAANDRILCALAIAQFVVPSVALSRLAASLEQETDDTSNTRYSYGGVIGSSSQEKLFPSAFA